MRSYLLMHAVEVGLNLLARLLDAGNNRTDALSSLVPTLRIGRLDSEAGSSFLAAPHGLGELLEGIAVLVVEGSHRRIRRHDRRGERRREVFVVLHIQVHREQLRGRRCDRVISEDTVSEEVCANLLIDIHDIEIRIFVVVRYPLSEHLGGLCSGGTRERLVRDKLAHAVPFRRDMKVPGHEIGGRRHDQRGRELWRVAMKHRKRIVSCTRKFYQICQPHPTRNLNLKYLVGGACMRKNVLITNDRIEEKKIRLVSLLCDVSTHQ